MTQSSSSTGSGGGTKTSTRFVCAEAINRVCAFVCVCVRFADEGASSLEEVCSRRVDAGSGQAFATVK